MRNPAEGHRLGAGRLGDSADASRGELDGMGVRTGRASAVLLFGNMKPSGQNYTNRAEGSVGDLPESKVRTTECVVLFAAHVAGTGLLYEPH